MAKTKALISCPVTAQLICVFVFANANCWFSNAKAHIILKNIIAKIGKNCDIFNIFLEKLIAGTRDGSNRYPQSMFWISIRNMLYPCIPQYPSYKSGICFLNMFS